MTVEFIGVGREKKSWTAEVQSLSDRTLIAQIKAQGALRLEGIDFDWISGDEAEIYVGGFRHVGFLRVNGMSKRTKPGEPPDMRTLDDPEPRFDPARINWEPVIQTDFRADALRVGQWVLRPSRPNAWRRFWAWCLLGCRWEKLQ